MSEQDKDRKLPQAVHPRPACRCGATFILIGNTTPGEIWRVCPHCDKPHQSWTAHSTCTNCAAYAKATSGDTHQL